MKDAKVIKKEITRKQKRELRRQANIKKKLELEERRKAKPPLHKWNQWYRKQVLKNEGLKEAFKGPIEAMESLSVAAKEATKTFNKFGKAAKEAGFTDTDC